MDYDEEQIRDVYAHYGLVMYLSQILEYAIVTVLVALRSSQKNALTRQDIDEFMEGRFHETFGILCNQLRLEAQGQITTEFDQPSRQR
ncbi:hypothetical protein TAO_0204 [Candidatus Nitrosoglobus terrae]|uniref:Uncharacterized protein n=1 Tax=Candidatus Nitrosoglobus terrae TaxID=1630141 RepID=A0A1Q2SKD0_9GAMM|nr:hypothetical protein [Candidatus Nitrosoglobus terrae]BAW79574.1 hypothetical protein TAO_0204 [Candidatus Nitrosoglobus terrae]